MAKAEPITNKSVAYFVAFIRIFQSMRPNLCTIAGFVDSCLDRRERMGFKLRSPLV
jgi:hypothetical protein